jgi:hypothetical protein
MIILTTETTEQTFNFITRNKDIDFDVFHVRDEQSNEIVNLIVNNSAGTSYNKLQITDEQTNITTELNIISSYAGEYYHTITSEFNLIEGHFYMIRVYRDSTTQTRFLGKVFCTDQSLPYKITDGIYNQKQTDNDFIIYE